MSHNYFVYILTNPKRTILYTGVTNDLAFRIEQHFQQRGKQETFAGRFYCFNLVYYELFDRVEHAIDREKQIKGWTRKKKEILIARKNPDWKFLNDQVKEL